MLSRLDEMSLFPRCCVEDLLLEGLRRAGHPVVQHKNWMHSSAVVEPCKG